MNNYALGLRGEIDAAKFLKKCKYKIIEQNFRCGIGEIDIVAQHGAYLVFLEVKARNSAIFGLPSEAVDIKKQRKLIQLAKYYQKAKGLLDKPVRFDVVEVLGKDINLIQGAFEEY